MTANGQITTSAPSEFTSTLTSTNSAGEVSTITQIVVNPTLSSDSGGGDSACVSLLYGNRLKLTLEIRFFKNKGAVAGVFLIVGLAAASVCIWIIFSVRRRRKKRLLEREAALAAPTGHRSPLEDEDDEPKMTQSAAVPITARPPSAYFDDGGQRANDGAFDPYVGYAHAPGGSVARPDGYVPARTSSPPAHSEYRLGGHQRQPSAQSNSNTSGENGAHSRTYSFSSYEPLLAAAGIGNKTPPESPGPNQMVAVTDNGPGATAERAPTPPPRNPMRPSTSSRSAEADDRLDPVMTSRLHRADTTASGIRDDLDYSRPVLGVR